MPYPVVVTGQRVTSAMLNAGNVEFVTNAAGSQASTSATVVNVTDLVFPIEANARYYVRALISFTCAATGDGFRVRWVVPSGATMGRNVIAPAAGSTTGIDTNVMMVRRGAATEVVAGGTLIPTTQPAVHEEIIDLVTSSTAGTAQLQFGIGTAPGTATVQADCMIYYQRVA